MATIEDLKELQAPDTPLFLFECILTSGDVHRWSTSRVALNGLDYAARVLKHNVFELRSSSDDATDGVSKVSITLANADSFYSPIERTTGWKGAQLTVRFVFFDLVNRVAATETRVIFRGIANPPEESTEAYLRLSFTNRLSLQRVSLPQTRIQKRCPWSFPTTPVQLTEAIDGGLKGKFSPFYRCGYSAGVPSGVGTLSAGQPFGSCDHSRAQCESRGMFSQDQGGRATRRFGGIEFVPATTLVRGYGEKGSHLSIPLDNTASYNDVIPLIYGTGWYQPPIVFARNDGNLTHTELLLGCGEISSVIKVIVNGVEIPEGVSGANMTATGWYNLVTAGTRTGAFNLDFVDTNKQPVGDPYGSLACLSVVVPNRISYGQSLPQIAVLLAGLKLARFDLSGALVDEAYTNNPAWVLLDVLRRSGWSLGDMDLPSFYAIAQRCDQPISTLDLHGNATLIPRFQCNLILARPRSTADIVRGIRTAAQIYVSFNSEGLMELKAEDTLAAQQSVKPLGSNAKVVLNGGWPAYEFGDASIVRRSNGEASLRTSARPTSDSPNLFTLEFQDEFNEYQQDSMTLVDTEDSVLSSQQLSATLTALGIPNFDQATRITSLMLSKSLAGNLYVDFETSVRAVDLRPGDIVALSYSKEGWDRQPLRLIRIAPASNYRTAAITAQIHDDDWYSASGSGGTGARRSPGAEVGLPRPLIGSLADGDGSQFAIVESSAESTDGTVSVQIAAGFVNPAKVGAAGAQIPLVGLNAQVSTTGGTLHGGQNFYYGVTALDSSDAESGLSFLVKAVVPAGTDTNVVVLPSLSFAKNATGFNVYRGVTPAQLLQVGGGEGIAAQFTDAGLAATLTSPPDINFDHANFYWRIELQPDEQTDIHSASTVGNSTLHMLPDDFANSAVRITKGTGAGQEQLLKGNTATTLTLSGHWDLEPDSTSFFAISESSWQFGATGASSPVSFDIPNREGTTVQVSGRSANVRNEECSYELSPVTRWRIEGSGGSGLDGDVPPAPVFGLSAIGQGTVEMAGISFPSYVNTRSVSAGTLILSYWDELKGATILSLSADLDDTAEGITLAGTADVDAGALVQIEGEIMTVQVAASNSQGLSVTRASYQTAGSAHSAGTPVYVLNRKVFVMPFARDFFGSLSSGDYAYPVYLPDARISAAELFVTNSRGNSDATRQSYLGTVDQGLRILSGGQLTIQVEGMLAVQTDAAPPLSVEASHAVRDVFATVGTAPVGGPIQLQVTQAGLPLCTLTIADGRTTSDVVSGLLIAPLNDGALVGLNILAVSTSGTGAPGSDLTVTVRL